LNLNQDSSEESQRRTWSREHPAAVRLRRRLRRRFPELLRHLGDAPTGAAYEVPLSAYGIEFGPGWLPLFETVCQLLTEITPPSRRRRWVITQAKEKYAELRVHLDGGNDRMRIALMVARKTSRLMCQDCGRPARLRKRVGWYYTLCDRHWQRRLDPAEQARSDQRAKLARAAARRGLA
jgi:hypothetical protein